MDQGCRDARGVEKALWQRSRVLFVAVPLGERFRSARGIRDNEAGNRVGSPFARECQDWKGQVIQRQESL